LRTTWRKPAVAAEPSLDGTLITTYDIEAKSYRQWSFDSSGTVLESHGVWDPVNRTMTWTGKTAEFSHNWTQALEPNGAVVWRLQLKNTQGVFYESSGRSEPRKIKPSVE